VCAIIPLLHSHNGVEGSRCRALDVITAASPAPTKMHVESRDSSRRNGLGSWGTENGCIGEMPEMHVSRGERSTLPLRSRPQQFCLDGMPSAPIIPCVDHPKTGPAAWRCLLCRCVMPVGETAPASFIMKSSTSPSFDSRVLSRPDTCSARLCYLFSLLNARSLRCAIDARCLHNLLT